MVAILMTLALFAVDPSAGTAGFDFLRITPTAREAALGGTAIGAGDGPMSFWFSPAHARAAEQRAQFNYTGYVAGVHAGALAYSRPVGNELGIGLGLVFTTSGTMKRTNESGEQLGTFGASFTGLNVSGSYDLGGGVTAGAALQGLYGSIDTFFSLGLAANAGAAVALPLKGLSAGVSVRNAGFEVKPYRSSRDPLPLDLGAGLSFRPSPSFALAADLHKPIDNRLNFGLGIEGWVGQYLVLRGGYSSLGVDLQTGGSSDILAGICGGLGVRYKGYQVDYAVTPMLPIGVTHRVSLAFSL
ncbi:MAG: PorV/PorQ family protein [bacterium]